MIQKPSRRDRKKEKTRQTLLEIAIRLIAERGIYGTRVEDITERGDLGKGAFYNYFESKDRLIAELVSQGIELLHRDYLGEPATASHAARVDAVVAAHEAFFRDHPAYVVLFHQARGLIKIRTTEHAALAGVFGEYLRRTGHAIASPEERARLSDADLIELAAVVLGTIAGSLSFRVAAGLDVASPIVREVLAAGVPAALAARLRR